MTPPQGREHPAQYFPVEIAIDATNVYWTDDGTSGSVLTVPKQ